MATAKLLSLFLLKQKDNGDAQMKNILSYGEIEEKLEKIEIPDEIIDLVNEALERGIATRSRFIGLEIGSEERQVKEKYLIALIRRLGEQNYKSDVGNGPFCIDLNGTGNTQEKTDVKATYKRHKLFRNDFE